MHQPSAGAADRLRPVPAAPRRAAVAAVPLAQGAVERTAVAQVGPCLEGSAPQRSAPPPDGRRAVRSGSTGAARSRMLSAPSATVEPPGERASGGAQHGEPTVAGEPGPRAMPRGRAQSAAGCAVRAGPRGQAGRRSSSCRASAPPAKRLRARPSTLDRRAGVGDDLPRWRRTQPRLDGAVPAVALQAEGGVGGPSGVDREAAVARTRTRASGRRRLDREARRGGSSPIGRGSASCAAGTSRLTGGVAHAERRELRELLGELERRARRRRRPRRRARPARGPRA